MQGKSTLPAELYREIFQHISKRDLCVLSRSSRVLQADAEFFIYQHIESCRRPETTQFCSLITKTARFHSLVRTLHISNGDDPTIGSVEYWSWIAALLGCLAHLEDLRIYDSLENPNAWVLASCSAHLSKIGCDFLMDQYLASFFQSQVSIRRIDWTDSSRDTVAGNDIEKWAPEKSQFPPSATMLTTNSPRFALKMLGSSPLTHLWIYGPCAPPGEEEGWLHFIQNFRDIGTLRSLRLSLPHRRRPLISVLAHLAKYALNLRSLGFVTWFDAKDQEMFSLLAGLKKLSSLVTWSVISAETSRKLAEWCPSLRLVACLHYSYSHEYVFLPVNPMGIPHAVHDPEYKLWKDA